MARILSSLARGGGVSAYRAHRHHRSRENRRKNRSIKENKQAYQRNLRQTKQYEKDVKQFMKGPGKEKFIRKGALNPEQKSVLKNLLNSANKGIKHPEKLPGEAEHKKIPKLQKLEKNPVFQEAQAALLGNLSQNPQDYEAYAAPLRREFQSLIPQISQKYAGQGATSGLASELAEAQTNFGERLARLRADIRQNALGQSLEFANAPAHIQQQRIANRFAENQAEAGRNQTAYGRAMDQRTMAYNQANLGLGVQPYHDIYRPATPPILPAEYAQQSTYQPQPSTLQRFIGAAAPAIGSAVGSAGGAAIGAGIGNAFQPGGAPNQIPSYTRPQSAPAQTPQRTDFGYQNQLGGRRPVF